MYFSFDNDNPALPLMIVLSIIIMAMVLAARKVSAFTKRVATLESSMEHMRSYDNWLAELWNSKNRLRPLMHPDTHMIGNTKYPPRLLCLCTSREGFQTYGYLDHSV